MGNDLASVRLSFCRWWIREDGRDFVRSEQTRYEKGREEEKDEKGMKKADEDDKSGGLGGRREERVGGGVREEVPENRENGR